MILTEGAQGMRASIERAEDMVASDPGRWVLLQQFQNPANPEIHFKTTGPEIWEDTQGKVDVLVAGIGTGGTITGISRYFKLEKKQPLLSIGVEPEGSAGDHADAGGAAAPSGTAPASRESARGLFRPRWT